MFLAIFQVIQCMFLIFHFFSGFLPIFHVLPYVFLIFLVFLNSRHIPGLSVCVSHFPRFSVFSPKSRHFSLHFFNISRTAIFHVLPCHFSFSSFVRFLDIFHDLHCFCLIFQVFRFLATIQILMCIFLIFHGLHCFSPYSRSYNVCVSFSMFFNFVTVTQFLQCVFLIFHVFHCFLPYSRSYSVLFIMDGFQCFWPYLMS